MTIYELFRHDAEIEFTEEETFWTWVYSGKGKMLSCWVYWNAEA